MKLQLLNIIRIVDDKSINEISYLKDLGFKMIEEKINNKNKIESEVEEKTKNKGK